MSWKTLLRRLLICYLIAAAIHTLVLLVAVKPPHSGMGPLVVYGFLFFWAAPAMTIKLLLEGGYDPSVFPKLTAVKALMFFVVPFLIAGVVAFRRELTLWRHDDSPPAERG